MTIEQIVLKEFVDLSEPTSFPSRRTAAEYFAKTMRCNCDLDNWEPERSTGHSWVCRIHKKAMNATMRIK